MNEIARPIPNAGQNLITPPPPTSRWCLMPTKTALKATSMVA